MIHSDTVIGDGCQIGDHAVLGKRAHPAATSANKSPEDLPPTTFGDQCIVGAHAVVYRGTRVGEACLIADASFVREDSSIADHVIVGTHVTVENQVTIGSYTKIQTGAYITSTTVIEDNVFIAPCVVTTNDNHMGRIEGRPKGWGGPTIRRGARVGADVTLLPMVEIGEDAFVAAASVVTRDVPARTVVMGSPARMVRHVPDEELLPAHPAAGG